MAMQNFFQMSERPKLKKNTVYIESVQVSSI